MAEQVFQTQIGQQAQALLRDLPVAVEVVPVTLALLVQEPMVVAMAVLLPALLLAVMQLRILVPEAEAVELPIIITLVALVQTVPW
jgi:hypothetical protein